MSSCQTVEPKTILGRDSSSAILANLSKILDQPLCPLVQWAKGGQIYTIYIDIIQYTCWYVNCNNRLIQESDIICIETNSVRGSDSQNRYNINLSWHYLGVSSLSWYADTINVYNIGYIHMYKLGLDLDEHSLIAYLYRFAYFVHALTCAKFSGRFSRIHIVCTYLAIIEMISPYN